MKLEAIEMTAYLCSQCLKMCRHICTTHSVTRNEADNPTLRAAVAYRALKRGEFLPEEVPLMYERCATCSLCKDSCAVDLDVGEVMLAARADIVDQGLAPQAAIEIDASVSVTGNPMGEPAAERFVTLKGMIEALPAQADTLYFIGCQTLYREPEIAIDTLTVLKAADVSFTVLKEEEFCCGEPQYLLGFLDNARASAERNAAAIARSGAKKVVFNCPSCLRVMKEQYPQWGVALPEGVELVHLTQFVADLLASGALRLEKSLDLKATYHDPCDLGRKQGIYDEPRAVIGALPGVEFSEMMFSEGEARCCGAGGMLSATNMPVVIKASRSVIDMAEMTGAGVLITACPTCKSSFARHTRRMEDLETLDVIQLVAKAIGK